MKVIFYTVTIISISTSNNVIFNQKYIQKSVQFFLPRSSFCEIVNNFLQFVKNHNFVNLNYGYIQFLVCILKKKRVKRICIHFLSVTVTGHILKLWKVRIRGGKILWTVLKSRRGLGQLSAPSPSPGTQ